MEDDEVRALVRILKRIMEGEFLTVQGMARRLGFATSHLSMILRGQRRPGLRFMWAVMERYPEVYTLMRSRQSRSREDTETPPGAPPGGE
jgi:transcriptional regulator with XRE-family HTH domain